MADSAAERARRAYRHKRGDHTMCDPARRCEQAEQEELLEAVQAASSRPVVEGCRGEQLRSLLSEPSLGPLHLVLVEEAARIADRLDRLDLALSRKGEWLRIARDDDGDIVVTVDSVLAESRQQATTLKALVAEIRTALPAKEPEKPEQKTGGLGDLSARIAARRGSAAG